MNILFLEPGNRPVQLTDEELKILADIIPMMKIIEWAISDMSGESYSTDSIVI